MTPTPRKATHTTDCLERLNRGCECWCYNDTAPRKATHTPTPWRIDGNNIMAESYTEVIGAGLDHGDPYVKISDEDAALIVHRVNMFDELEKSNAILRRMVEKATGWTCEEIEEEIARTESRNPNER